MPKKIGNITKDEGKPIRVRTSVHATLLDRAANLSWERGKSSSMTLPDYIEEASAFFETNRPKPDGQTQ